jgi:hypothetical protein
MRQVLAELELISHGSTQSWNSAGGGKDSEDSTTAPPGEMHPPHLEYLHLWDQAVDDQARALIRKEAEALLESIRGHGIDRSRVVGESLEQEDARILAEGKDFPVEEVARRFHCTPTRVRRVRLAAEQEAFEAARAAEADAAAEARRMEANGLTQRQIALTMDRPRRTIRRWLETVPA